MTMYRTIPFITIFIVRHVADLNWDDRSLLKLLIDGLLILVQGEGRPVLDWATRVKVAAGAARGIAYLHEDCKFPLPNYFDSLKCISVLSPCPRVYKYRSRGDLYLYSCPFNFDRPSSNYSPGHQVIKHTSRQQL